MVGLPKRLQKQLPRLSRAVRAELPAGLLQQPVELIRADEIRDFR
jgi:hypothetical protein